MKSYRRVLMPCLLCCGSLLLGCSSRAPELVDPSQVQMLAGTQTTRISAVTSLDLSEDGTHLVIGGTEGLGAYNTKSLSDRLWHQSLQGVKYTAFGDKDEKVVLVEDAGLIILANAQTGGIEYALTLQGSYLPTSAELSPNGEVLAIGTWGGTIVIWDVASQHLISILNQHAERTEIGGQETLVMWSSDGKQLIAGGWSNTVLIWDIATNRIVREFKSDFEIYSVALSPDEKYLVASSISNQAEVWEFQSGVLIKKFDVKVHPKTPNGASTSLAWSQDSAFLAMASGDETMVIRKSPDFSFINESTPIEKQSEDEVITDIGWSPDNNILYIGIDSGRVVVWDMTKNKIVNSLEISDLP